MSRQITFRTWDKKHKCMQHLEMTGNRLVSEALIVRKNTLLSRGNDFSDWMQFTGLKDKAGKDIYESDLLITAYCRKEGIKRYSTVVYVESEGSFKRVIDDGITSWKLSNVQVKEYGLEVIGNIYQNPELLK